MNMKRTSIIFGASLLASCTGVTNTTNDTSAPSLVSNNTSTLRASGSYPKLDKNCLPVVIAIEQRMKQSAYLRTSSQNDGEEPLKNINANDVRYAHVEGDEWEKLSGSVSAQEQDILAGIESGKIGITNCKDGGSETIDGVDRRVLSYSMTMALSPELKLAYEMTQYTGVDGLVYKERQKPVSKMAPKAPITETTYQYKGVTAPAI